MNKQDFAKLLQESYDAPFSGWDFSRLSGRMEQTAPPWNYRLQVEEHIKNSHAMLDMGTGGGEFLDSLPNLPAQTCATEGYLPNLPIAQTRLAPKGVQVRQIQAENIIPFEDHFFDLVINRHEEYDVNQVFRVLKPGGLFITQQVGGLNDMDINARLGGPVPAYFHWCLLKTTNELMVQGFEILKSHEYTGSTRFYDVDSLVYYLKCIPWQIPDFSIEHYLDRLYLLHLQISAHGYTDFINQRFYLVAKKTLQ